MAQLGVLPACLQQSHELAASQGVSSPVCPVLSLRDGEGGEQGTRETLAAVSQS